MMIIIWHRRDLRLSDHPPLTFAAKQNKPIIALYIDDCPLEEPENSNLPFSHHSLGKASRFWLHHALKSLQASYAQIGRCLLIKKGDPQAVFADLLSSYPISAVYWNRCFEPHFLAQESLLKKFLSDQNVEHQSFNGNYLIEPSDLYNQAKKPYKVFTPFYRTCQKLAVEPPLPNAKLISGDSLSLRPALASLTVDDLNLLPKGNEAKEMSSFWQPGEANALCRLKEFCQRSLSHYEQKRDIPSSDSVSRLSPYLHFGEISPRTVFAYTAAYPHFAPPFERQLYWREFGNYLLYHFPDIVSQPWKKEFLHFPWQENPLHLQAWQKGLTGYPIVDAAMRQLARLGWMHNRARLIAASFLVKDLNLSWQSGARWFWETLVDADLAQNSLNWQWVAGSGPDAAPFFRIFNPVLQGEKWDPQGDYIRTFVQELALLPAKWIHQPWLAPKEVLFAAKVTLGKDYPYPLVDHSQAKERALKALRGLKKEKEE